jgi:ABC-type sugar transport system ATPase subunit
MIECRGIRARVGSFTLRDISFVVPAGGHAILTGPTASGKTTLLELIAGDVKPESGAVFLAGRNVTDAAPETRGAGLVPQQGYLFPHLDTRRNIEYGARDLNVVTDLVRRFGISALLDRAVRSLSGGERQLVALCRALASRPAVLLLDEPFSALDEKRREAALRELSALQREWEFTALHATHNESDVAIATVRFVMVDGALTQHSV